MREGRKEKEDRDRRKETETERRTSRPKIEGRDG
jgi:hypothetical protein